MTYTNSHYGRYDDEPEDECCHEEYDTDWEGRATCDYCGHTWWKTAEEMERDHQLQIAYDKHERRQIWRERWDRLTWPFRWAWYRIMNRIWPRKSLMFLRDDEIPF